ncbi:MAG: hypothetical protein JO360_12710 [Acidobacteria bacterium]|nr:hypothetical protein [Acidobacteriota bacterium]
MRFPKSRRRAIVLLISLGLFVVVTVLRFFVTGWGPTLNVFLFPYALAGFVIAFLWAEESWRWGLWLVASLWGIMALSILFSDFHALELFKNFVPLCIATIASCFGAFLGAKFSRRA